VSGTAPNQVVRGAMRVAQGKCALACALSVEISKIFLLL
jgi:hypothetical protein